MTQLHLVPTVCPLSVTDTGLSTFQGRSVSPWSNKPDNLLKSLTSEAQRLLSEITEFQRYLHDHGRENSLEIRAFRSSVLAESNALKRLVERVRGSDLEEQGDCDDPGDTNADVESGVLSQGTSTDHSDATQFGVSSNGPDYPKSVHRADIDEVPAPGKRTEHKREMSHHALRSSNLPFISTVWTIAKQCHALKALTKRYYLPAHKNGLNASRNNDNGLLNDEVQKPPRADRNRRAQGSVLVDIVSSDGSLWTKVSLMNDKRLIYDMAKEGYGIDDDESENEDDESSTGSLADGEVSASKLDLEIIRLACDLHAASNAAPRVRYLHPRVRLVLPRLSEVCSSIPQIRSILTRIRSMDIEVICKEQFDSMSSPKISSPTLSPPSLSSTCPSLTPPTPLPSHLLHQISPSDSIISNLPNDPSTLTSTLNLDCTILLALVSDISHLKPSNLNPLPPHLQNSRNTFHSAIRAQIAAEEETAADTSTSSPRPTATSPNPQKDNRYLPTHLYPVLTPNRTLITTLEAATRMAEIVRTIGTPTERRRVAGFFGPDFSLDSPTLSSPTSAPVDNEEYHILLSHPTLSDHPIPSTLLLPIRVIPSSSPNPHASPTPTTSKPHLPSYAPTIPPTIPLSPINAAIFMTGWTLDVTTVTSNRVVARAIGRAVCAALDSRSQCNPRSQLRSRDGENMNGRLRREGGDDDDDGLSLGPRMWVLRVSRSLVGKERVGERE